MAKTWEGQLKQYMKEFDFRIEAENVKEGFKLYGIADGENPALGEIAEQVSSMKLSPLAAPQKNGLSGLVADESTILFAPVRTVKFPIASVTRIS